MRSILASLVRRHATAVAYLALFAALGGSVYAAVTVTGKNIKDGTVTGKDIRNRTIAGGDIKGNSLSGAQINENGLGQVPSAATAGSAQSAQSAQHAQNAQTAQNAENAGNLWKPGRLRANGAEAVHVIGAPGEVLFNTGWGLEAIRPRRCPAGRTPPEPFTCAEPLGARRGRRERCSRCRRDIGRSSSSGSSHTARG